MAQTDPDEQKPLKNELFQLLKSVVTTESVAEEKSDLHRAAVKGDIELLKKALSSGQCDINLQDDWDRTALFIAVQKGHGEIANILISYGAKINADNDESFQDSNPLHVVSDVRVAELLLKAGGDVNATTLKGDSPLHRAVMREDLPVILLLLNHGADVNKQNTEGWSPLHTCCNSSGSETVVSAMKYIISNGGNVNLTDNLGMTPLHHLAKWCATADAVNTLISAGSDVHIIDYRGNCPVHYFRSYFDEEEESFIKTLKEFIVSAESANVRDFRGQTPLHLNTDTSAKVIDKLIKWGCQVNLRDNQGKTALHVASGLKDRKDIIEQLLKVGDVNVKDNWGRTPLHEASKLSNHVIVETLISYNADPNAHDICRSTPLHEAALKQDARTVDMLAKNGADVNNQDINMSSPLHFAAWEDSEKSAEYLLAHGANIDLKDNLGYAPLDIAHLRGAENVVSLLTCSHYKSKAQKEEGHNGNIYAFSNCGGKYLSFDTVSKMINNNEIKRKNEIELHPFLRRILESPAIGRGCDENEAREIQLAVEELVNTLADRIGKTDSRIRCSLIHAGSMSEGTKTRCPDEFDFIFVLEEFSKHCYPLFSDIDSKTQTGVHIPAHMSGKKELPPELETLDERPKTTERTLSVSVSDYANILINKTVESEPYAKFAGSNIMPVYKMYDGFEQLITKVLFNETFPQNPKITVLETSLDPAMKLCWRGCRYKNLEINIDLVPAIVLREWPEQFQKDNILLTSDILRLPSLVVPKMTAGADEDLWRCSLAPEESAIFRKLKPDIRNSYIACKALISSKVCPQISFDGYEEVMGFYRMEHDSLSSEENIEVYESVEHIVPSYMLKMLFFAAIANKAKTEGINSVYTDNNHLLGRSDTVQTQKYEKASVYGPAEEMYVAEKSLDLDVPLVLDVFKRCAECIDKRFVPSVFNPKHNVLGARVMEGDLDKVAIFINFIQKLLE